MIVIVMGMSKSGTTLISRTLDASGINFRPERKRRGYPACPYENKEGCDIIMRQIGVDRKKSLFLPEEIKDSEEIPEYIKSRSLQDREWGFKFPYITFVYDIWKKYLPKDHIAIASKRSTERLLFHYWNRGRKGLCDRQRKQIIKTQKIYNDLIDSYNIPVIQFEDFIKKGPVVLEKIIGRKLPDVRDGKKH
jgi:hypothetical protein